MKVIKIEKTTVSPKIILDKKNNIFEFKGRSRPEDAVEFYQPILDWFDEYKNSPNDETCVHMDFEYFNTTSAKLILDIIKKIKLAQTAGKTVKIIWHYQEDDEDMQEAGEDYEELVGVPFEFKEYE